MDASERVWAPAAAVLVVPHVLIDPQHPHPPTNTRSPTLNSEEPENVACNSANRPSRFESER